MVLDKANVIDDEPLTRDNFNKGDYVENDGGTLLGWKKADFEAAYVAIRAPRTVKANKNKKKPLVNHGARVTDGVIV